MYIHILTINLAAEQMNLLTVVLRAPDEPVLSRVQMHRLAKAHRAHAVYLKHRAQLADSDDDDGPQDEDAWLLEDLKVLTHLYSKLRDREQLIALIFEVSPRFLCQISHRFSIVYHRDSQQTCSRISSPYFMHPLHKSIVQRVLQIP